MSEIKVCVKSESVLETEGVSTCIVIMLHGSYDNTPFILMDHWNGEVQGNEEIFLRHKLCNYITKIQDTVIYDFDPDIHDDIPVYIKKLVVIGGEKKQLNIHGELLVSGTESSVNLLKSKLKAEIDKQCTLTKNFTENWDNYLTSGNQSIKVKINIMGITSYIPEQSLNDVTENKDNQRFDLR